VREIQLVARLVKGQRYNGSALAQALFGQIADSAIISREGKRPLLAYYNGRFCCVAFLVSLAILEDSILCTINGISVCLGPSLDRKS
jgi:hypothetical protein